MFIFKRGFCFLSRFIADFTAILHTNICIFATFIHPDIFAPSGFMGGNFTQNAHEYDICLPYNIF